MQMAPSWREGRAESVVATRLFSSSWLRLRTQACKPEPMALHGAMLHTNARAVSVFRQTRKRGDARKPRLSKTFVFLPLGREKTHFDRGSTDECRARFGQLKGGFDDSQRDRAGISTLEHTRPQRIPPLAH